MSERTHAIQLNCMNEWTKSRFEVILTPDARNKNLDGKTKNNWRPLIAPAIALRLSKIREANSSLVKITLKNCFKIFLKNSSFTLLVYVYIDLI